MDASNTISHKGVVTSIRNGLATLLISEEKECHSCSIREFCGQTDRSRNTFVVHEQDLHVGDHVQLHVSSKKGGMAVFIAYFVPFLILLTTILISLTVGISEPIAGLLSLAFLVLYFTFLHLYRRHFTKWLDIEIERI